MQILNSFTVAVDPATAWRLLLDVPRMARCMPGATLTEAREDRSYAGNVVVKLGPVRLAFAGEARITALDETGRRAKVEAKGSDTKGRGSAQAKLDFVLVPDGSGTRVDVTTDLQLTGSVAQYGRGASLIKEVANQLVGEFAGNLARDIAASEMPTTPAVAAPTVATATDAAPAARPAPAAPVAPAPAAAPVSGLSILVKALRVLIGDWFKRLFAGNAAR
jgi:carbon monoxide dehydrogenase subunit G